LSLALCFHYLDDHLIASRTVEEHLGHLYQCFALLDENDLQINPAKCAFTAAELGHRATWSGIRLLSHHVKTIQSFPMSSKLKQLL
jgi:hypothetical protein